MTKQLDYLVLEAGSGFSKAHGFIKTTASCLELVAQGYAPSTVNQGNVGRGIFTAINNLETDSSFGTETCEVFAGSSASSVLSVTFHGLDKVKTRQISECATEGSGAVSKLVTFGDLSEYDIDDIEETNPDLIILVGEDCFSSDFKRDQLLTNALKLSAMDIGAPVVYYGNASLKRPVENIFHRTGIEISFVEQKISDVSYSLLKKKLLESYVNKPLKIPGLNKLIAISNHNVINTLTGLFTSTLSFCKAKKICSALVLDFGASKVDAVRITNALSDEYPEIDLISFAESPFTETKYLKLIDKIDFSNSLALILTGGYFAESNLNKSLFETVYKKYKALNSISGLYIDKKYAFSALGNIGAVYPELALNTFANWKADYD